MSDGVHLNTRFIQPILSLPVEDQSVLESVFNEMVPKEQPEDLSGSAEASDPLRQVSELQEQLVTIPLLLLRRPPLAARLLR